MYRTMQSLQNVQGHGVTPDRVSDRFRVRVMALGFRDRVKFRVMIRVWTWSCVTLLTFLTLCLVMACSDPYDVST